MPKITVIPATRTILNDSVNPKTSKRRVAGYARVSTDHDEQFTSYEAQIDYYTNYIRSRNDWEFAGIYTDEGISGLSTKHREGFKKMVADAKEGKIDLIVTKSISRFARNTVDSLSTIRDLKEHKVEVYFEKENLWTFDSKCELIITIMSSIAQEESRSISENCTWGQRKRFADGKASVAFGMFLGYDRGPNGEFVVNEEQAETVREIFRLFLEGKSPWGIADILTKRGIPTPSGTGKRWGNCCIMSILSNEKYIGDALLQKRYTEDYITKKMVKNDGRVPQYYVNNHHEAIVSREIFAMAQAELRRIQGLPGRINSERYFQGRIVCGECGNAFGRKIWHSNDSYRSYNWKCNGVTDRKNPTKCKTGHLREDELQELFIYAVNQLIEYEAEITDEVVQKVAFDTTELEARFSALTEELESLVKQLDEAVKDSKNSTTEEFDAYYNGLVAKYNEGLERRQELDNEIKDKKMRSVLAKDFMKTLSTMKEPIDKFDPELFCRLVDKVVVYSKEDVRFHFKNGTIIETASSKSNYHAKTVCKGCGAIFDNGKMNRHRKYCSQECYQNNYLTKRRILDRTPTTYVCQTCGKSFIRPKFTESKYCSNACKFQAMRTVEREIRTCPVCGKKFEVLTTDKQIYCSRQCGAAHARLKRQQIS